MSSARRRRLLLLATLTAPALAGAVSTASADVFLQASNSTDQTGFTRGYVSGSDSANDRGATSRVELIRGGTTIASSDGPGGAGVETPALASGDVVRFTDVGSGRSTSGTYTGAPAFDPAVCAGSTSFVGTRDADGEIAIGVSRPGEDYSTGSFIRGVVTGLAGTRFIGTFSSPLDGVTIITAYESRTLAPQVSFSTSTTRPAGACPAIPVAAPVVATAPPVLAATPPLDKAAPQGRLGTFAARKAYRALLGKGLLTTVTLSEPGTVSQTLYLSNGASLPAVGVASAAKRIVLAKGTKSAGKAGAVRVRIKLTARGRKQLRRKVTKVALVTTLRDRSGNRRTLTPRRFSVRRGS